MVFAGQGGAFSLPGQGVTATMLAPATVTARESYAGKAAYTTMLNIGFPGEIALGSCAAEIAEADRKSGARAARRESGVRLCENRPFPSPDPNASASAWSAGSWRKSRGHSALESRRG